MQKRQYLSESAVLSKCGVRPVKNYGIGMMRSVFGLRGFQGGHRTHAHVLNMSPREIMAAPSDISPKSSCSILLAASRASSRHELSPRDHPSAMQNAEIDPCTVVTCIMQEKRRISHLRASGMPFPKRPLTSALSLHAWKVIEEVFKVMDVDGSNAVTYEEARSFFKGAFSRLSAEAMFNEVDVDGSGAITPDEFIEFWIQVKSAGYKEPDIIEVVDELMTGAAWVDWNNVRDTGCANRKPFPQRPFFCRLSVQTWQRCKELFGKLVSEDTQAISHEDATLFFKGPFGGVSADEMFRRIDLNAHGHITAEDFMAFWVHVRNSGYKDKNINTEIDALMEGAPWVKWDTEAWVRLDEVLLPFPKRPLLSRLSAEVWGKCQELFHKMDEHTDGHITLAEANNFFKGSFTKFSAQEMFATVDKNNDGTITAEEFMVFWSDVRANGHHDAEVLEEVEQLLAGATWVDWHIGNEGHYGHMSIKRFPERPFLCKLSTEAWKKFRGLFEMIDSDTSLEITREKAEKFFKGAFNRLSAAEMFSAADQDGDGIITADEFMQFWSQVKASGHTEAEIIGEVEELMNGAAWVDWHLASAPQWTSHFTQTPTLHFASFGRSNSHRNVMERGSCQTFPRRPFLCKLSARCWKRCAELFKHISADGSLEITRENAEVFFTGSFNKFSVEEMFNQTDKDGDGFISAAEFLAFWVKVRAAGYEEKDILHEVECIFEGGAWVEWKDVSASKNKGGTVSHSAARAHGQKSAIGPGAPGSGKRTFGSLPRAPGLEGHAPGPVAPRTQQLGSEFAHVGRIDSKKSDSVGSREGVRLHSARIDIPRGTPLDSAAWYKSGAFD